MTCVLLQAEKIAALQSRFNKKLSELAEVEELVPNGTLGADLIHTPGIYVSRLFQGGPYKKLIEHRTFRARQPAGIS